MAQALQLTAAKALNLADDIALLEALGEVAAKWPELQAKLGGGFGSVEAVLSAIAGGDPGGKVAQAFAQESLATEFATIKSDIGRLISDSQLDPRFKALLTPLSALTAGASPDPDVKWTLSGTGSPPKLPDGYNLDLGGSATLELNGCGKWPGGGGAATPLLTIAADGEVDIGGSVKLKIPYGSVTFSGKTSASLDLAYYFDSPRDQLFALAVAQRLGDLADPFDLDSIWARFDKSDLAGITCNFNGSANAQVQVALGDTVELASGKVPVDLAATIAASVTIATGYQLSLRKQVDGSGKFAQAVEVSLQRAPVLSGEFSGNVGVTVDLSQLATPVTQILSKVAAQWSATLSVIKPFLSPGTWLQTEATKTLDGQVTRLLAGATPDLRAAILADLNGALGAADATDQAIATWLKGQIAGAVDRASVLVKGDVAKAQQSVVAILQAALPTIAQTANADLTSIANDAVDRLEKALEDAADQLLQTPENDLKKALMDAGARVTGAVNSLNTVLQPVRDLLSKVDAQVQDILAKANQALQQKITARVYVDDTGSVGETVVVDGVFTKAGAKPGAVYRALVTGDLQTLVSVVDGTFHPEGFTLNSGSITRNSATNAKEGIEVAFLSVDATLEEIVASKAQTVVDAAGNIHVDLQASISETFGALGVKRQVSFVETAALVQAAAMKKSGAVGPPVLDIGVSALYQSEAFTWVEVSEFISGLSEAKLLSDSAPGTAQATFTRWAGAVNGKINGSISGGLRLSGAQVEALLKLQGRTGPKNALSEAAQREIIAVALKYFLQIDSPMVMRFSSGKRALIRSGGATPGTDEQFVFDCKGSLPDRNAPVLPDNTQPLVLTPPDSTAVNDYNNFLQAVYGIWQVVDMIDTMGQIYLSIASPGPGQPGWTLDQYKRAQDSLVYNAQQWVNLDLPLTEIMSAKVSPWTIAFLRVVADLAGGAGAALTMTYTPTTGDPKTAAFG